MAEIGEVVFLSWVRGTLAARGSRPGPGVLPRLEAKVQVGVSSGASAESVEARFDLFGPADAGGISPSQVLRTDPKMGEPEAEPNYLCAIEFDAPELPWALSPDVPDAQSRLQPWIALVVVPEADDVRLQQRSGGSLPLLRCPAERLPNCAESWAWAHAQLVPHTGGTESEIVADPAEASRTLSRLICPTRLEPHTRYIACVVPTYEAGVRVQTGREVDGAGLNPAWPATGPAVLPVYYTWRFRTGPPGDFEEVATLLHPVAADSLVGLGRSDIEMGADAVDGVAAHDDLPALRTLLTTDTEARMIVGETVPTEVADRLLGIVSPDAVPERPPKVRPPAYGEWPAQIRHLGPEATGWIADLNRSPAHRIVARLGGDMVRAQQEELVAEARRQAGEYERARIARDRLRLAELTAQRLFARRVQPLDPPRLIATVRPAHADLAFDQGRTVAARIANSTVDGALMGRSMARVVSRAARQMRVVDGALRRNMLAGTFGKEFVPRPVALPELTGEVEHLRDVYVRARLIDRPIANTTIAKLIDASAMMLTAHAEVVEQVDAVQVVFVEVPVEPAVEPPVDPPVDPRVDPPIVAGGREPGFVVIGGIEIPIVVSRGQPDIDVGPGPIRVGPGRIGVDPGLIARGPGLDQPIGAALHDQPLVAVSSVLSAHVLRPDVVLNLGTHGTVGGLINSQPTLHLSAESNQALTGLFSSTLGPVAAALGSQVSATDVGMFTLDEATAQLGKRFREKLTGAASPLSQVSVGAAMRAKLGLQVVAPIHRDGLPDAAKVDFDNAITAVMNRALTPTVVFPAAESGLDATAVSLACVAGLQPKLTHAAAVERVLLVAGVRILQSPLELRLGFVPQFTAPVAARLERSLNGWILAGAGSLPANSITLVVTNPAFVEAFLAGANHEVAGELLWRDVPSDPRGTVFTRFWAATSIDPIHRWTGALGTNVDGGTPLVAVVLRSPLLRRYPNTIVYAAKRLLDGEPGFTPDPDTITPIVYQGFIEPDTTFSVLALDVDRARDPNEGWFVLVSQPVTDSRFGLDDWIGDDPAPPAAGWNELSWGHMPGRVLRPVPGATLPTDSAGASWGASAGDMARILHQDPFRVVMPAAPYLPPRVV